MKIIPAITANVNIIQINMKFLENISGKAFTFSSVTSAVFSCTGIDKKFANNGKKTNIIIPIAKNVLGKLFSK